MPSLPFNPRSGVRLPCRDLAEIDIFYNDDWELFEHLVLERWRPTSRIWAHVHGAAQVDALLDRDVDPETGTGRINEVWKNDGSSLELGKPSPKRGIRTVDVSIQALVRLDLGRPEDQLLSMAPRSNE
ncbi:hypothetical protein ACIHDR_18945 [Nocardia sp. NPDC052278]|uniref:hypothetical protein n=1 Tax=unclassified Nocardia TaxID=2637762 RepID=UPI0036B23EE0